MAIRYVTDEEAEQVQQWAARVGMPFGEAGSQDPDWAGFVRGPNDTVLQVRVRGSGRRWRLSAPGDRRP